MGTAHCALIRIPAPQEVVQWLIPPNHSAIEVVAGMDITLAITKWREHKRGRWPMREGKYDEALKPQMPSRPGIKSGGAAAEQGLGNSCKPTLSGIERN